MHYSVRLFSSLKQKLAGLVNSPAELLRSFKCLILSEENNNELFVSKIEKLNAWLIVSTHYLLVDRVNGRKLGPRRILLGEASTNNHR